MKKITERVGGCPMRVRWIPAIGIPDNLLFNGVPCVFQPTKEAQFRIRELEEALEDIANLESGLVPIDSEACQYYAHILNDVKEFARNALKGEE